MCRYGFNGVCASHPLDGVSERDYEAHVVKYHVNQAAKGAEQWSVYLSAQNLPAVLNDPSRGKQTNIFTKKWGDSFVDRVNIGVSPHLEPVAWDDFDVYMKRIGKRYKRHQRMEQSMLERQNSISSPTATNSKSGGSNNGSISNSSRLGSSSSGYGEADLKDIPVIFMHPNLELSEPQTFASVFPGISESETQHSGRLLQEQLSHYLDIVEVQIAKQVSQKSSAFFNAMTSQDTIMEKMNEAAGNVKRLRTQMRCMDEKLVKESLKVIHLQNKRNYYQEVLEKLRLMATVHQTQPMIQLLLGTQDYVAALDLIGTTQEICAQELIGVHCFRHLPSQLSEMERLIDKMLTTDFERYSAADLNRPWATDAAKVLDEDKLVCIVSGLLRKKNFNFVDTYKEEAIVTIKAIIKQLVIEVIAASDAADDACLTGNGEEAQSLSLPDWIRLLESATRTLTKVLQRIKAVHDVMLQIADVSAGAAVTAGVSSLFEAEAFLSSTDHRLVLIKLKDLLQAVCHYSHERCANLISNQSMERSIATADQIAQLSSIVTEFTGICERISGTQSTVLKAAVTNQGNRFAQKFHAERKSKMALLLDNERWKQADVPAEFQKIIESIGRNDFVWEKRSDWETAPASAVLIVDGEPYALVGSALLLVQIVSEYCRCAAQVPLIAMQMSRNVVDLLRTFNSRCCQLVLGAGAMHTAGLKTITSGNLALVSRALQLVLWLLVHVKAHFQELARPTPLAVAPTPVQNGGPAAAATTVLLSGYDSIEKDFVGHIKEIEAKVLSIVTALLNNQLDGWDARPPVPSQAFRSISRHFVKLHEAIAPIFPEPQIHNIYRTVNKSFKDKLREQLLRNNIVNNGGPQHGVVTAELTFYLETLRTLKAMPPDELYDEQMQDIWLS